VCNQTDTAAKHEQAVQDAHAQVVFCLFWREGAAVAEEVNKADGDATVHIEDQIVFLGGSNGLDGDGVVEKFVGGEVLDDEFLDELDTQIRVGARLDTVADTGDYTDVSRRLLGVLLVQRFNLLSLFSFLIVSTNSLGLQPLS
jgi:hypothetical protein